MAVILDLHFRLWHFCDGACAWWLAGLTNILIKISEKLLLTKTVWCIISRRPVIAVWQKAPLSPQIYRTALVASEIDVILEAADAWEGGRKRAVDAETGTRCGVFWETSCDLGSGFRSATIDFTKQQNGDVWVLPSWTFVAASHSSWCFYSPTIGDVTKWGLDFSRPAVNLKVSMFVVDCVNCQLSTVCPLSICARDAFNPPNQFCLVSCFIQRSFLFWQRWQSSGKYRH